MLGSYLRTEGEKIRNVYPKYDPVYKLILTILILLLLKKNLYVRSYNTLHIHVFKQSFCAYWTSSNLPSEILYDVSVCFFEIHVTRFEQFRVSPHKTSHIYILKISSRVWNNIRWDHIQLFTFASLKLISRIWNNCGWDLIRHFTFFLL